jgi:DNA-binding Lrp family transcriptional regulator
MTTAYVLIKTEPGETGNVVKKILKIKGIISAYAIAGPFDIIALAEAEDFNAVGKMVVAKVQKITGVSQTITCQTVDL